MNREEIYDEKISPLMKQIIAICKEYKIPTVAQFELDDGLRSTTVIVDEAWNPSEKLKQVIEIIKPTVPSFTTSVIVGNKATGSGAVYNGIPKMD